MGGNNVFMIYKKKQNIGRGNKVCVVFFVEITRSLSKKIRQSSLIKNFAFPGTFFIGEETCIIGKRAEDFFALHLYQSLID